MSPPRKEKREREREREREGERERRKERKEEEKLSGSEHDTPSSSLGLRKIRVFPENSQKIAGGEEKARSKVAKAKRASSLSRLEKRTFSRSAGRRRRFIHLSLSVRGAPLSLPLSSFLPVHYKIHTQHTKNAGRSVHGQSKHHQFPPSSDFPSFLRTAAAPAGGSRSS